MVRGVPTDKVEGGGTGSTKKNSGGAQTVIVSPTDHTIRIMCCFEPSEHCGYLSESRRYLPERLSPMKASRATTKDKSRTPLGFVLDLARSSDEKMFRLGTDIPSFFFSFLLVMLRYIKS